MHLRVGQRLEGNNPSEVFEVTGALGEGRTGEVYEVRDVAEGEGAERRRAQLSEAGELAEVYALKIARAPREELNSRIERELRALVELAHESILKPVSSGSYQGRAFLVTERLEGKPLVQYLRDYRMRFRVRVEVFLRIAEAVEHCHQVGVAHRELRPSNIFMVPERGPVLMGFGSCAWFDSAEPAAEPADRAELAGAAKYRLEEPSRPGSEEDELYPAEAQEDVYALGVLLYSLLTGRLPGREPFPPPLEVPGHCLRLAEQLMGADRPPDARAVPRLVRSALARDEDALSRFAPPYEVPAATWPPLPESSDESWTRWWERAVDWLGRRDPKAVALSFVVLVLLGLVIRGEELMGELSRKVVDTNTTLAENNRSLVQTNAILGHGLQSLLSEYVQALPKVATVAQNLVTGAMKMPEKPESNWLRPDPDGKCRDPITHERMVSAVVRGSCWRVGAKGIDKYPCPDYTYDPPPEIEDPVLKQSCFEPILVRPKTAAKSTSAP